MISAPAMPTQTRFNTAGEAYNYFKAHFDKIDNPQKGFIPFLEHMKRMYGLENEHVEGIFYKIYREIYEADTNHYLFRPDDVDDLKSLGELTIWTQTISAKLQTDKIIASQIADVGADRIYMFSESVDERTPNGVTLFDKTNPTQDGLLLCSGSKEDYAIAQISANHNTQYIIIDDKATVLRKIVDGIAQLNGTFIKPVLVHIEIDRNTCQRNRENNPQLKEEDKCIKIKGCNSIENAVIFLKGQGFDYPVSILCDLDDTLHRTTEVTKKVINAIFDHFSNTVTTPE
jgi:hypothetical protein